MVYIPKILYQLREIKLLQTDETKYIVVQNDLPLDYSFSDNPLEAWQSFISCVDYTVRKRIGDMLESQGKDRYTGEPKAGEPSA